MFSAIFHASVLVRCELCELIILIMLKNLVRFNVNYSCVTLQRELFATHSSLCNLTRMQQ